MNYEEIIEAAYWGMLSRASDQHGRESARQRLSDGMDLADFFKEIVDSTEFRGTQPFINEMSQFGEVQALIGLWAQDLPGQKVVVDAGARGKARSNSYDFMRNFGWRGILIEANRALHPEIERDFDGTKLVLVDCAVSDFDGEARFSIGINNDVSSLSRANAAAWGEPLGETRVAVRRLPNILAEQEVPLDFIFLSLDLEGEDVKVLNDLVVNSDYRPNWVAFEGSASTLGEVEGLSKRVEDLYSIRKRTKSNIIVSLK